MVPQIKVVVVQVALSELHDCRLRRLVDLSGSGEQSVKNGFEMLLEFSAMIQG